MKNKVMGTLMGLAIGDAIGTTVEFKERGSFPEVTDMTGGGPFNLKVGQWTDDTSMALCLADSIINVGFDCHDQMTRYCKWWKQGYMSSTGKCFDIGFTTRWALDEFLRNGNAYGSADDRDSASGNGGLMRIAPVVMAYHDHEDFMKYVIDSTLTTHASDKCIEASILFCSMIKRAYSTNNKMLVFMDCDDLNFNVGDMVYIQNRSYLTDRYEDLSGSGYVLDTLKTALWCFHHTYNFRDAILKAVNVGDDADTVAAVTGQIAGAFYGLDGIPKEWVDKIYHKDLILSMSEKLYDNR